MAITKINTPELFDLGATNSSLQLPSGNTASRPTNPSTGEWRYNTDDNKVEYWDGADWFQIDYEAVAPTCTTNTINYPTAVTAYYKMEDATDETGNYNGTPTNVDFNVAGKFGNAGEFNGSSSKISLNNTAFQLTTYSISFWVNSSDYNTSCTIYDGGLDNDGSFWGGIALGFNANKIFYYGGDVAGVGGSGFYTQTGTTTITNSTWYNVTLIVNGTSITGYINGTQDTGLSRTLGANIVYRGTPGFNLGVRSGSFGTFGYLNGKLDQVRIFPSALTAAQATELYNEIQCAPTIVPSEHFNVNTYVGNGSTQTIDAKFNEAAAGFAYNKYITFPSIPNVISSSGNYDSSISIWINLSSLPTGGGFHTIIGRNGTGSNVSELRVLIRDNGSSTVKFELAKGFSGVFWQDSTMSNSFTPTLNQWYNLVITYTASTKSVSYYVDGASYGTGTLVNGGSYTMYSGFNIGSYILDNATYSAFAYFGKVDQFRIFNTALTASQVTDLYTNETTATAQLLDFPVGAGCVAAYQFDGDASDVGGTYGGVPTNIGYTGLQFQPDFVWIKNRNGVPYAGESHALFDSVRGIYKGLFSNDTSAEVTNTTELQSFDTNGFTLGSDQWTATNYSGGTYVAWCWKAGGAAVSNTDGTITSTVSANQAAGFSIVSYTGNGGGSSESFGHGLSQAPELYIVKERTSTSTSGGIWSVGYVASNYVLFLNSTTSASDGTNGGTNGAIATDKVTSTVFGFTAGSSSNNNFNNNGSNYIAYCFHSVDGFSKIGSYVGTGVAGNAIVTGFQPAFVMIKNTASGYSWIITDSKRQTNKILYPNLSNAEFTVSTGITSFTSNGFILGTDVSHNNNGDTFIYLAIAADPAPEPVLANSFDPVLYTGTGSGSLSVGGVSFQPDLVWGKARTDAISHILFDSVRGENKQISSNTSTAEVTRTSDAYLFDSNGFTVTTVGNLNNAENYVAWCWKAAGIPAINQNGTIDSIVNANPAAGFSIVKYTGNNTISSTFGHGLSSAPELVIIKNLDTATDWQVFGSTLFDRMQLNNTGGDDANFPLTYSSTTITLPNFIDNAWNNSGYDFIAYCFHSVTGYQKVGSYTGTGAAGNAQNVGFAPRWLIIKRYIGAASNWVIFDTLRTDGSGNKALYADLANAEASDGRVNLTSTGFDFDGAAFNESSTSWIYLAIA